MEAGTLHACAHERRQTEWAPQKAAGRQRMRTWPSTTMTALLTTSQRGLSGPPTATAAQRPPAAMACDITPLPTLPWTRTAPTVTFREPREPGILLGGLW